MTNTRGVLRISYGGVFNSHTHSLPAPKEKWVCFHELTLTDFSVSRVRYPPPLCVGRRVPYTTLAHLHSVHPGGLTVVAEAGRHRLATRAEAPAGREGPTGGHHLGGRFDQGDLLSASTFVGVLQRDPVGSTGEQVAGSVEFQGVVEAGAGEGPADLHELGLELRRRDVEVAVVVQTPVGIPQDDDVAVGRERPAGRQPLGGGFRFLQRVQGQLPRHDELFEQDLAALESVVTVARVHVQTRAHQDASRLGECPPEFHRLRVDLTDVRCFGDTTHVSESFRRLSVTQNSKKY